MDTDDRYFCKDKWVVVKFNIDDTTIYRLLVGIYGSWRLNSGIVSVDRDGDDLIFNGVTGSKYVCNKHGYGLSMTNCKGWTLLFSCADHNIDVEKMPEDTDWHQIDYNTPTQQMIEKINRIALDEI